MSYRHRNLNLSWMKKIVVAVSSILLFLPSHHSAAQSASVEPWGGSKDAGMKNIDRILSNLRDTEIKNHDKLMELYKTDLEKNDRQREQNLRGSPKPKDVAAENERWKKRKDLTMEQLARENIRFIEALAKLAIKVVVDAGQFVYRLLLPTRTGWQAVVDAGAPLASIYTEPGATDGSGFDSYLFPETYTKDGSVYKLNPKVNPVGSPPAAQYGRANGGPSAQVQGIPYVLPKNSGRD